MIGTLGTTIQTVGLALMVGGMLALGAFTAPVIFKQFARPEAGEAMTLIFRRYDTVLLISLVMVLAGEGLRWLQFPPAWNTLGLIRGGLLLGLTGMMAFSLFVTNPKMQAMEAVRHTGQAETFDSEAFDKLHNQSESLYKLEMLAALLLLILTPFYTPAFKP